MSNEALCATSALSPMCSATSAQTSTADGAFSVSCGLMPWIEMLNGS